MMERVLGFVFCGVGIYLLLGISSWLLLFLPKIDRIDTNAKGSSVFFRILLLPGVSIFWPYLTYRWILKKKPASVSHSKHDEISLHINFQKDR